VLKSARTPAALLSSLLVLACIAYLCATPRLFVQDAIDFRSFYCATQAVLAHRSPYTAQPLRTCENATARSVGAAQMAAGLVLPAPLPGYAFVFFSPLALLPYAVANIVYDFVLIAGTVLTVVLVARLTGVPPLVVAAALALGLAFQSLRLGQIVPLVLLLLVLGAALLERGRYWACAAALGAAMIEPHVGTPALACVFIVVPRMRLPVAIVGASLALLSVAALGIGENIVYLHDVLPAHAAAELPMNTYQFSLTNLLHQLGVADGPALFLGECSYVVMSVAGIALGAGLATRFGRKALLVLCPCAIALLGGPFVHLVQIVCAVPLALFLLASPQRAPGITAATLLLASPWLELLRNSEITGVILFVAVVSLPIAWYASGGKRVHALALTLAMMLIGAALSVLAPRIHHRTFDAHTVPVQARAGNLSAEVAWTAYTRRMLDVPDPLLIAEKLPTWAGLLILLGAASAQALAARKATA
jgi:hypothetical protein